MNQDRHDNQTKRLKPHGYNDHDRELIERHGWENLNFDPNTPPEYR